MKINYSASVGLVGCDKSGTVEIDDNDLEGLNEAERNAEIEDIISEEVFNHIDWGWSYAE